MNINFPFQFDHRGHTSVTDDDDHIRDMIGQVLFTSPGERVNRPDFGSGLMQMVFEPNSTELATATQFLIKGALQQWLGTIIEVTDIEVANVDSNLNITVKYTVRRTRQAHLAEFTRHI